MENKPIDRWLTLGTVVVGIVLVLLTKTPTLVVLCVLLMALLLAHPIWYFWWIEETIARRFSALAVMFLCLYGIGYLAWPPSPTVMYFVPGLTMDDNASRAYAPQFNGDQPLFNVSVTITDQSALATTKKENRSFPGEYWEIPFIPNKEEIDPRHSGLLRWYLYKPYNLNQGALEFDIESREIDLNERLEVYQTIPHTFPAYYLKVVRTRPRVGKLLKECVSDSRYTEYDKTKSGLPLCCGDLYPQEGIYASCAPWYIRALRLTEKPETFLLPLCGRK
jgi:hypothetical protein